VLDEILRRHGGEGVVEGQGEDDGGAGIAQRRGLGGQQREAEGRVVGAEMLARMGLEGQRGERRSGRAACAA
jgi:hypothetical protein